MQKEVKEEANKEHLLPTHQEFGVSESSDENEEQTHPITPSLVPSPRINSL
jgi:hypothetical protein